MIKKTNNKGMTLVEIVVVLLIASIIVTITGGILVNSLGYFDTTTKKSLDKQTLDGVLDFISNEITYATDVRVSNTKPDDRDWHYLYVLKNDKNKGRLYRDGKAVFDDDYYINNRDLQMDVRGFTTNGYRLDLTLKYLNGTEEVYSTKNTYELVNFNINTTDKTTLFSNVSSTTQLSENTKLYYIKDDSSNNSDDNENPKPTPSPTPDVGGNMVGNQINCLNTLNNWGMYAGATNYPIGVFVYHNNSWWQLMEINWNCFEPGNRDGETVNRYWKKIDDQFDYSSYYEVGDIVVNNGKKYICIKTFGAGATFYTAYYDKKIYIDLGEDAPDKYTTVHWKTYFKEYQGGDEEKYGKHNCKPLWQNNLTTVAEKLKNYDLDKVENYSDAGSYAIGSIVKEKYYSESSKNGTYDYCYYLKVLDGVGKPGSSASSGWQILDNSYRSNSAYLKSDVVYCGGIGYIKASNNISFDNNPSNNIYQTGINWDKIGG